MELRIASVAASPTSGNCAVVVDSKSVLHRGYKVPGTHFWNTNFDENSELLVKLEIIITNSLTSQTTARPVSSNSFK